MHFEEIYASVCLALRHHSGVNDAYANFSCVRAIESSPVKRSMILGG